MRRTTLSLILALPLVAIAAPESAEPDGGRPSDPQSPAPDERALPMYESYAPEGSYLVGLDVSSRRQGNGNMLYFNSIRPLYAKADGGDPVSGKPFVGNTNPGKHSVLVAKKGYAVAAVIYHQNGTVIDGLRVVFDRVAGDHFDTSDSYPSPWVGEQGKVVSDSHGSLVVGVRAMVGTNLHTIELVTEQPGNAGTATQPAAAPVLAYHEPDSKKAPFAAERVKLPAEERAKLATTLAMYAGSREPSAMTPKLMGIALAIDPENRAAVLTNLALKRGATPATSRPTAAGENGDLTPVKDLLEAAKACKGSKTSADMALASCLYDLVLTFQPAQEDALYESELLRRAGHSPDWRWAVGTTATDAKGETEVVAANAKSFVKQQVTVKGLSVVTDGAGLRVGQVLEIILTVSPQSGQGRPVDFSDGKIGSEMRTALDEAVRTVQFRYPAWERKKVVVSFNDKYAPKDGGSAGTAFALGLLSALEGWEVDPKFAVTGDITVDGKVRGIGGVDAKVRGAATDGCEVVSVPADNSERVGDYLVLTSPKALAEIQIFASSTLTDATNLARTTRPEKLQKAIDLFTDFQSAYNSAPTQATLTSDDSKDKLRNVLELAPNHLSAKYLLLCAEAKQPKKLSAGMSLYRMALATNQLAESLRDAKKLTKGRFPESVFAEARAQLRTLRGITSDETVQALQTLQDFVESLQRFNRHAASEAEVSRRFDAWRTALTKLSANPDTMAKLLREGI